MKKLIVTLMIVVSFSMQALAYDFQSGNLLYSIIWMDPPQVSVDGHIDGQTAQGELVIFFFFFFYGTTYSVTEIKEGAFYFYTGLEHLTIGEGVEIIGRSAFERCSGLTGDLVIPKSVNEIRLNAFYLCSGLESLTIAEGVEFIGESAFNGCTSLAGDLVIPNTVYEIGIDAFYDCHGFDGNLVLPDNLAIISTHAFYNCNGFTGQLIIPESVVMINWGAFEGCSGFSGHLEIPDSLEEIEETAFSGCNFTSLVIGSSVSKIHSWAFKDNPLQSMTIKAETPPVFINADILPAFENVPKNIPVIVPCGTLEAYRNAEGWNEFTNITEDCDGINEIAEAISVFPNPAQSFVHVEGFDVKEIQCYNELGQLVKRVRNSNEISVSDLPEGVYLLRITDVEGENHAKRLAVNR